jgi:hypothetical protein
MVKPVTYGGSKRKDLKVYKEKQSIPNKLLSLVTPSVQAGVIGTCLEPHAGTAERKQPGTESSTAQGKSAISSRRICKAIGR